MPAFRGLSVLSGPELGLVPRSVGVIKAGTVEQRLKAKGFSTREWIPIYTTEYVHPTIAAAIDAVIAQIPATQEKVLDPNAWNSLVNTVLRKARILYIQTKKIQTGRR